MTQTHTSTGFGDLARRRTQMGASIRGWGAIPGSVAEVADTHWLLLSGAPSADFNVALVQAADPAVLHSVLATVQAIGAPALVCLTGDAPADAMPEGWQQVGTMPFMAADLEQVPLAADPRVRLAGPADLDATADLLADAYGMPPEIARLAVEPVVTAGTAGASDMRFWLLVEDGTPVSAVLDARTGDAVTLWCMSTPGRFARRGHARALLAHVLRDARADGRATGLLGATPAGKPLYDATGWCTLEEWRLFVSGESVQFS